MKVNEAKLNGNRQRGFRIRRGVTPLIITFGRGAYLLTHRLDSCALIARNETGRGRTKPFAEYRDGGWLRPAAALGCPRKSRCVFRSLGESASGSTGVDGGWGRRGDGGTRSIPGGEKLAGLDAGERGLNVLIELIKAPSHVFTFRKHDTLLHARRLPRRLGPVIG